MRGPSRVALLVAFAACSGSSSPPAATVDKALAALGPQTTLNATVTERELAVTLGTSGQNVDAQCPSTHAQATMNGAAMATVSSGSGATTAGYGDGPGCGPQYTDQCTAPSFSAVLDPATTNDVNIQVSDETATIVFHVQLAAPTVALQGSGDGLLHIGQSVMLALTPVPSSSDNVTIVFGPPGQPDAGGSFAFSMVSYSGEPTAANVFFPDGGQSTSTTQRTPTGISFVVPAIPTQSGVLQVGWNSASTTFACSGVMACNLAYQAPAATLATSVAN